MRILNKYLPRISCFSLAVFIFSCGSNDENDMDDEAVDPILANWVSIFTTFQNCDDPAENRPQSACTGCFTFSFKEDGTFLSTVNFAGVPSESSSGTYSTDGNILETCFDDGECVSSQFSINGSEMTITGLNQETGCEIKVRYDRQ